MDYKYNIYKNFDKLVLINKQVLNSDFEMVRIEEDQVKKIDFLMNELYKEYDKDTRIKIALNILSKILMFQPFFDGNSRTIKIFTNEYFNSYGIKINLNEKDKIIPIMYYEDDVVSEDDLNKFKEKIL